MNIVKLTCPNCNSNDVIHLKDKKYMCMSCDTQFMYENPNEHLVINAKKKDYCPICGVDNSNRPTYQCTKCGTENMCVEHMINIYDKKIKLDTLCLMCYRKNFTCSVCGLRSTFYKNDVDGKGFVDISETHLYCERCNKIFCKNCAIKKGMIFPKYFCPICKDKLQ